MSVFLPAVLVVFALAGSDAAESQESAELLALIRDGYRSNQEQLQEVLAEGKRTFTLTTRREGKEEALNEEYALRWYQLGERIRYEHWPISSTRAGLETEEARKKIGRDIHLVLPDAYALHYESSGVTHIYDRQEWDRRRAGPALYVAPDASPTVAALADWMLENCVSAAAKETARLRCEATEGKLDGASVLIVRRRDRAEPPSMELTLWVDPRRGFFPIRIEDTNRPMQAGFAESSSRTLREITPIEENGVWFPKSALFQHRSGSGDNLQTSDERLVFDTLKVNTGELKNRRDLFSLHALPLTNGSMVIDSRTSKGYQSRETNFTYGQFGITEARLREFLGKLGSETGSPPRADKAAVVGDPELFLWDPEDRLYLAAEPLCGVFSLWTILALGNHGRSLEATAQLLPKVTAQGASLEELKAAATAARIPCEAVKLSASDLEAVLQEGAMAVLHFEPAHFVAAVGLRSDKALIADFPRVGLTTWSELEGAWSGNALIVGASPLSTEAARWDKLLIGAGIVLGVVGVWLLVHRRNRGREGPVGLEQETS